MPEVGNQRGVVGTRHSTTGEQTRIIREIKTSFQGSFREASTKQRF
ncbi:hypothetical protein SynBIOSU31_02058 [Synechococcus sp. BIOS-U3-1]|nr:hypothetical protein SynBIOSU31_02058 [Synechococcus sp. BIOS-U3-1]